MNISDVILAGIFTLIGATIGFLGTLVQSLIASKNNKTLIKLEGKKEIGMRRYFEKEKLYSDIISFLPQFEMSIDFVHNRIKLSTEDKLMLNSFKARLSLFSNEELFKEFYIVIGKISEERNEQNRIELINDYTNKLLHDLNKLNIL